MLSHVEGWLFLAACTLFAFFAVMEILLHLLPDALPKSVLLRSLLLVLISAVFYLCVKLNTDRTGDRRGMKKLMVFFFFLYLYLLLDVTLLDKGLGRRDLSVNRACYMEKFVNFRPFESIYDVYILGFVKGYVNSYYMLLNLFGNLCALMPLSFFLPLFFSVQKRWCVFLATVAASCCLIEGLQLAFMVGSCDVDDLILNTLGAMMLFFLLKIPLAKRWVKGLT
jgi:glycopeptide antibiotics resistance protein